MKIFFFHYNKPASRAAGKPQVTIHYGGKCHIVDDFRCNVPTWGHIRKSQPYFVVKGKCRRLAVEKGVAFID